MKNFDDYAHELRVLAKKGNYPRLIAIMKSIDLSHPYGYYLGDLTGREIEFLVERMTAERQVDRLKAEQKTPAVKLSRYELNKMKKAELVELLTSDEPMVVIPADMVV